MIIALADKIIRKINKIGGKNKEPKARFSNIYEHLYQTYAESASPLTSVGAGDFNLIGQIEKAILELEGLRSDSTLVDFGCGVGRLALQVIPELTFGKYLGLDISTTMLDNAARLVKEKCGNSQCNISWVHQNGYSFNIPDKSVDIICAFSVFTHIEHEDVFRYLVEAKKIMKDDGIFIFSCLPIKLKQSKEIFLGEAALDFETRWSKVRNVVTSIELMDSISSMAGWEVVKWIPADKPSIFVDGNIKPLSLGQSVCVLKIKNE